MARASWRDDPGVAAWSAFLRAHAAVVASIEDEVEKTAGLALGWYDVLLELNAADGRRLRMGELGRRAVLSRTRVSRIVDELEGAGLVTKRPDSTDRRSSWAEITAEGRATLRRAAPRYLEAVHRHFSGPLTTAQLEQVRTAMEILLGNGHP